MSKNLKIDECNILDDIYNNKKELMLVDMYNEVLRDIAYPVFCFNASLKKLSNDMFRIMYKNKGIGLAAPQVGLSIRFVVIDVRECVDDESKVDLEFDGNSNLKISDIMPIILVNPGIKEVSVECNIAPEGCLSIPGVTGKVKRPKNIIVTYFDIYGKRHILKTNGILSRCVQHELDHLDGILFIDHINEGNIKNKNLRK